MENTSRLDDAVVKLLRQPDCWQDLRQLYTLAWMVNDEVTSAQTFVEYGLRLTLRRDF